MHRHAAHLLFVIMLLGILAACGEDDATMQPAGQPESTQTATQEPAPPTPTDIPPTATATTEPAPTLTPTNTPTLAPAPITATPTETARVDQDCSFLVASSMVHIGSLNELAWYSDAIIVGTVGKEEEPQKADSPDPTRPFTIVTDTHIRVDHQIAGAPVDDLLLRRLGGRIGDCKQQYEPRLTLEEGAQYLFFLATLEHEPDRFIILGGHQGYRHISAEGTVAGFGEVLLPMGSEFSIDTIGRMVATAFAFGPPAYPVLPERLKTADDLVLSPGINTMPGPAKLQLDFHDKEHANQIARADARVITLMDGLNVSPDEGSWLSSSLWMDHELNLIGAVTMIPLEMPQTAVGEWVAPSWDDCAATVQQAPAAVSYRAEYENVKVLMILVDLRSEQVVFIQPAYLGFDGGARLIGEPTFTGAQQALNDCRGN